MNKQDPQAPFVETVKAALDQSQADLDSVTLARLRAARRTALQTKPDKIGWWRPHRVWLATAFSMVLAVTLWLGQQPGKAVLPVDDLPLLTASEDFELYRDLEFYQWLEYQREQS